jgi:hypothetical protein
MIPGTIVAMGGQDWEIPALSITHLRAFLPKIQQLSALGPNQIGDAQLTTLIEIVTAAMQRNYPELTTDKVEQLLDLKNAVTVLGAILGDLQLPGPALVGQSHAPSADAEPADQTVAPAPGPLGGYDWPALPGNA